MDQYNKSRAVGVVLAVFIIHDNDTYVLCNRRGYTTSEEKGKWNLPSGYLDWNESGEQAAQRECLEETGIEIPLDYIKEIEHSTDPKENRQNVIFRYMAILPSEYFDKELSSSLADSKDEVIDIRWIKVDDNISKIDFAWNQLNVIKRFYNVYLNKNE